MRNPRNRAAARDRELETDYFRPAISARSRELDDVAEARRRAEEKHGVHRGTAPLPHNEKKDGDVNVDSPATAKSRVVLRAAKLAKDQAKADAKMEKLRAARDAEYSFKPTLNDKTNAIAYRSSVASLAANARGAERRKRLEREAAASRKAECPFKPTLVAAPKRGAAHAHSKTDADRKRDRDDKRRAAMKQRDLDELMECSFQPNTTKSKGTKREARPMSQSGKPTAVKPVVVRGLARHLELRQRANALAEEQRTREHAAFHVTKADEWRQGQNHTKVEPFALST